VNSSLPAYAIIGSSAVQLWSIDSAERLHRLMRRAGLAARSDTPIVGNLLLFRADYVYEEAVVRALLKHPGHLLVSEAGVPVAAHLLADGNADTVSAMLLAGHRISQKELPAGLIAINDPAGLASTYNHALRKRARPYVLPLTQDTARQIEQRMFSGAYKGVTDFVTKYVWPVPAIAATRWCAKHRIAPNTVTSISFISVLLAMWLFWIGQFVPGLLFAWAMCFLDTVDGKLARVTLTSSKFGDVFDHGIDLIHPPFWYYAWYIGQGGDLGGSQAGTVQTIALWVILAGYILGRLQEGLFIWLYRIEIHTWRPIDSWFRLITARRNPNLLILSVAALLGQPLNGFLAVAIWTIISFLFHCWRIGQAARRKFSGETLRSWLTEPIAEPTTQ
jgi:phosphatidylglycerophosphate synthase